MFAVNGALDIRLMRTLLLLVTECSVSRTAEILGQTQPTVSLALKRLRELLGDPILVRSGGSLVPTERGIDLRESMRRLLSDIDTHLAPLAPFEPSITDRHFRIVAANCLASVFVPNLFRTVARLAPGARVDVVQMLDHDELMGRLGDGTIDIIVGNWPNPPEHLRIAPLLSTAIKCVVWSGHPLARGAGSPTMQTYLAGKHLSPTSDKMTQFSPIDGRLAELGLRRRIVASVPEYAIVPDVLMQSDLIFTTGAPFAEHMARERPFVVLDAPPEFGAMDFYLLWHDCKHHSPAHVWLRQMLKSIALEMKTASARPAANWVAAAE